MGEFDWTDKTEHSWDNVDVSKLTDMEKITLLNLAIREKTQAVNKQDYTRAIQIRDVERELEGKKPYKGNLTFEEVESSDNDTSWVPINNNMSWKTFTIKIDDEDYETISMINELKK
jgi:hypothetical protein